MGGTVPPWHRAEYDRAVERVRSGLGTEAFRQTWEAGRQCTVAEVLGLVLETPAISDKEDGVQDQEEAQESPLVL